MNNKEDATDATTYVGSEIIAIESDEDEGEGSDFKSSSLLVQKSSNGTLLVVTFKQEQLYSLEGSTEEDSHFHPLENHNNEEYDCVCANTTVDALSHTNISQYTTSVVSDSSGYLPSQSQNSNNNTPVVPLPNKQNNKITAAIQGIDMVTFMGKVLLELRVWICSRKWLRSQYHFIQMSSLMFLNSYWQM